MEWKYNRNDKIYESGVFIIKKTCPYWGSNYFTIYRKIDGNRIKSGFKKLNEAKTMCENMKDSTGNIYFTHSALGQPFFLKNGSVDCRGGICPRDWSPEQLREIADRIESDPDCKLYSDGSGV